MDVVTHGVPLSTNIPTRAPAAIPLGFDRATRDDYSARARVGDTACEATAWVSATALSCLPAWGVAGSLHTAVTAGMLVGSVSEVNPKP